MRAAELLLAAYLGGAASYAGVLLAPTGTRIPAPWAFLLALVWPASIVLAHEAAASSRGRT